MGGKFVEPGDTVLNASGIPTFSFPDTAARAFVYMWRYSYHLHGLYETPSIADDPSVARERTSKAKRILDSALAQGRTLLTEVESKEILAELDRQECKDLLARLGFGRLACAHENQPYIVPVYFAYEPDRLYGFGTIGKKIECMRSNPLVCVVGLTI
jgi:hypothetical protein